MDLLDRIDNIQNAVIEEESKRKQKDKKPEYRFDKLKMYFGEDCTINGITISIPKIGAILKIGESKFYHSLSPFLSNPTSIRVMLYDAFNHKDWTKTKDIETFFILLQLVQDKEPLKLIFKDLDFNDIKIVKLKRDVNGEEQDCFALVGPQQNLFLWDDEYLEIAEYIREMMHVHPKVEKIKGKSGKLWAIQEDKMNAVQEKKDENSSILLPLVSACINHPGFKYKLEELKDVNIYQFMDSTNRIQKYEQGIAAIHGIYGGMINSKNIPKELINFMGEL